MSNPKYLTKPNPNKIERIPRKCLKCDREFIAEGRFNRICPQCTIENRYIAFRFATSRMINWGV